MIFSSLAINILGRPQFDDTGVAVIMTTSQNREKYQMLVYGQEVIESSLHLHLIEHLNSETCNGTIADVDSAVNWYVTPN